MKKFYWADSPNQTAFPIARPGYLFIVLSAFITVIFALTGFKILAIISMCVFLFICYFFRDPDRVIPVEEDALVSPADGRIVYSGDINSCDFLDGKPAYKISIFMSVFNVHVNRIPLSGVITKVLYFPGKFFSANLDKASKENEHNAVFIKSYEGREICVVQIAGLIARRIICRVQGKEEVVKGQRFGMICFGSRLDVYLPGDFSCSVAIGDKVKTGTSILGHLQ